MEEFIPFLPFFIPLFILQFGPMIAAVVSVMRRETFQRGNKVLWLLISLLIGIIGPIVYFIFGKGDEEN